MVCDNLPAHKVAGIRECLENAGMAFDSNALVAELNERGARSVISQHPGRAQKLRIDVNLYAWRHLIENFICKLKEFKRIAMRACKTDQSFGAMIYLAAAVINSRLMPTHRNVDEIYLLE